MTLGTANVGRAAQGRPMVMPSNTQRRMRLALLLACALAVALPPAANAECVAARPIVVHPQVTVA